MNLDFSSLMLS